MHGSSPRVRGKHLAARTRRHQLGLIPARAGKISGRCWGGCASSAHPHACGENTTRYGCHPSNGGSSPRMQGKLERADGGGAGARLIPAHAGKTTLRSTCNSPSPAHPRACGENYRAAHSSAVNTGSSPRVRGKHRPTNTTLPPTRLIPARAGKTAGALLLFSPPSAHPRACGENCMAAVAAPMSQGSSPRVRGKLAAAWVAPARTGLIPARAGKTVRVGSTSTTSGAHPRACGENPRSRADVEQVTGSSPRVRGKRRRTRWGVCGRGLIPARAGKTPGQGNWLVHGRAHPRACGENNPGAATTPPLPGSSPRVRGKRIAEWVEQKLSRLIPARAGKTPSRKCCPMSASAHPRACGENRAAVGKLVTQEGSSPRVRGKRRQNREGSHRARLIPARAGKTNRTASSRRAIRAHPRACGENSRTVDHDGDPDGSSPRVRGKLGRRQHGTIRQGLIPARAGKTRSRRRRIGRGWAHPRACGENAPMVAFASMPAGSSPRVRGKRHRRHRQPVHRGLIPARAGKTPSGRSWRRGRAAHPRACGENRLPRLPRALTMGSSPRVRGKHVHRHGHQLDRRLIPARAGKTVFRCFMYSSTQAHPARAGKTRSCSWRACPRPAHPRACGEN